jgi:enoyl-[acyl-carrier-protein] reductase (NADH)
MVAHPIIPGIINTESKKGWGVAQVAQDPEVKLHTTKEKKKQKVKEEEEEEKEEEKKEKT